MKGLEINLLIPDLWQQEAVRALRDGRDVVIDAPTGAGKTYVFELLYPGLKDQAIFTVPTRALANDKLAEWRLKGWDVGIATGDLAWRPDARVVVATLETQKGRLLHRQGPRLLVVDEYQMIGDPVRGVNYELALALAPPETQLLLLSGSVANPDDVVTWLRRIGRDAALVSNRIRPVPIDEVDIESLPGSGASKVSGFWPRAVTRALRLNLGPILVFAPRRNAAEELARHLASALPPDDPLSLSQEQESLAGPVLAKLLHQRIAFHHSGLSYAVRAGIIEPLAKNGHLRVVVATMGLAAGINFSVRSVLVTGTSYMSGNFEKQVEPDELLQMFGRAGRRGLDETGYVITTSHPRLHDARAGHLRRARQVDWTTLLSVMAAAVDRGEDAIATALEINGRWFSAQKIHLGLEHSQATGPMPCGISIDMARARFVRRGLKEMLNSRGQWEPMSPASAATLGMALVYRHNHWRPLLSLAESLDFISFGALCKLSSGTEKRYGREVPVATILPEAPENLQLVKWLRKALGIRNISRSQLATEIAPRLQELSQGGRVADFQERGGQLVARLDFSELPIECHTDSHGSALVDPPVQATLPLCYRGCSQLEWCQSVEIVRTPAHAWLRLGLVDQEGTPTRRGRIFSFFNAGEGLAIAAALEADAYPLDDLVFDLANLRAGHRFAGLDSPLGGRLGVLCQQVYDRADDPGYLELGVPVNYGSGASEVVRAVIQHSVSRHRLITESLRPGDIERAIVEWRSLLRHLAAAPDLEWPRWRELKELARQFVPPSGDVPPALPELLPAHLLRRASPPPKIE